MSGAGVGVARGGENGHTVAAGVTAGIASRSAVGPEACGPDAPLPQTGAAMTIAESRNPAMNVRFIATVSPIARRPA